MAKILISSTSEDLLEHRKRLKEILERLKQDIRGMEVFGADPNTPVDVCRREVENADVLVLVVAHRYGWVPRHDQGGDGKRSITRMEFDWARNPPSNGKPKAILAFVVDEKAPWTTAREQDRLVTAKSGEEAAEIFGAVQSLKEFKVEIGSLVRETFSTPDDLAAKAAVAVANLIAQSAPAAAQAPVNSERDLQHLMEKIGPYLEQGLPEVALLYLERGYEAAAPSSKGPIADKRLEIAMLAAPSPYDERRLQAANAVIEANGSMRAKALLTLGACKSQAARKQWGRGERDEAWSTALAAQASLEQAISEDGIDPDIFGTLGGLLKRMAAWATERHPEQTRVLEDAMLEAYRRGSDRVPHAYPLLNYLEQRAVLSAQRSGARGRQPLIGANEDELRRRLAQALKSREGQLGNVKARPWATICSRTCQDFLKIWRPRSKRRAPLRSRQMTPSWLRRRPTP
jgi:hypothetical protein